MRWCQRYGVDETAYSALARLHPEAQRRIMDEGPLSPPHASQQLLERVWRMDAWEHGYNLQEFLRRFNVGGYTEQAIRAMSFDQQRAVLGLGPPVSSDPMWELERRA